MLRSVLVAAFSAVVAFGSLGGFSGTKGDVRADSAWSFATKGASLTEGGAVNDDSAWS
ncbi:hypothetical protein SZN_17057 [Streptomyces zinciresistens K42]|uniref:Secreted protein n=2 Tax=Streptomyces TaxID=1883 RepID=G2GD34_9ACTN|nr:hypothetical protein SZN_17057 [Streptomyces zinciresistens K42]